MCPVGDVEPDFLAPQNFERCLAFGQEPRDSRMQAVARASHPMRDSSAAVGDRTDRPELT